MSDNNNTLLLSNKTTSLLLNNILKNVHNRYRFNSVPLVSADVSQGKLKVILKENELVLDNLKTKKWFLSSCSGCKINAIKQCIEEINVTCKNVLSFPCKSNVSEQPWGRYETILGAWNRHTELYNNIDGYAYTETKILITIENGLYPEEDGSLSNVAFIIMESINPCKFLTKEVLCCNIPENLVIDYTVKTREEKPELFKQDTQGTFGLFLQSKDPTINPKDWSGRFHPDGQNRLQSLTQALTEMYIELFR